MKPVILPNNPDEWQGVTFTMTLDRPRSMRLTVPAVRRFHEVTGFRLQDRNSIAGTRLGALLAILSAEAGDPITADDAMHYLSLAAIDQLRAGFHLFSSESEKLARLATNWAEASAGSPRRPAIFNSETHNS